MFLKFAQLKNRTDFAHPSLAAEAEEALWVPTLTRLGGPQEAGEVKSVTITKDTYLPSACPSLLLPPTLLTQGPHT